MIAQAIPFLAAFIVGASKGGLPVVGMLAVPLMAITMPPVQAATLLLPIYMVTDVVGVYLYRRQFSARNLKILIPAGIAGVVLGWLTAAMFSDRALSALIGSIGIAFCLNAWLRARSRAPVQPRPASVPAGIVWGTLSGFTSFVSHSGGPPFQIYVLPQKLPKLVFAGTSTIFFAVINAAKLPPYMQLRPYSMQDLQAIAWLLPAAIAGTVAGAWLTRRLHDRWFFIAVQVALLLVSLRLLYEAL